MARARSRQGRRVVFHFSTIIVAGHFMGMFTQPARRVALQKGGGGKGAALGECMGILIGCLARNANAS